MSDVSPFALSVEQSQLRETAKRYFKAKREQKRPILLNGKSVSSALSDLKEMSELGFLGVLLPSEVGGSDCTIIEATLIAEEIGRNLLDIPFLSSAILAAMVVRNVGLPHQKIGLLTPMVEGQRILALGYDEGGRRQHIEEIGTIAQQEKDGSIVISGSKTSIIGGHVAHEFIIAAKFVHLDGTIDPLRFLVIGTDNIGLEIKNYRLFDGTMSTDIIMDNVKVGHEALLGSSTSEKEVLDRLFEMAVLVNCAEMIGAVEHLIQLTREHLQTRSQFGSPISAFQALQHRFVDMCIALELSRSALFVGLEAAFGSCRATRCRAIAAAKVKIGDSARSVSQSAVQLHGATGVLEEHLVGRMFKRLSVLANTLGPPEFHRELYANNSQV